jgi:predicted ATP-dependent endonuclease of OLD family
VKNLWGYKNYNIPFFRDVNVIIGPNASGKTTLINILYDVLSANIPRLCRTTFSEVIITLRSFDEKTSEKVVVAQTADGFQIEVGKHTFKVPLLVLQRFADGRASFDVPPEILKKHFNLDIQGIQDTLRGLVPAVWLPVSRRLPIAEEDEMARRNLHRKPLESVDECLASLIEDLQKYRLSLNAELSELRKQFQQHALANILFDKKHDKAFRLPKLGPPSESDKQQLLKAFRDVGLVDSQMEIRIDEHFAAAGHALTKLKENPQNVDIETVLIIPLIARTRAIVEFAQELENKRENLFSSLHTYESIVNSFLNEKTVNVSDKGELIITPARSQQKELVWRHLSSGEKQILILLTQALLSGQTPIVYVADEPELSLHVTWQEKLLVSLTRLAGQCQFIVATHSPDIASGFGEKVIDLARI